MKLIYKLRGVYFGSDLPTQAPLPPIKAVWFPGEQQIRVFNKSTITYGFLKYEFKKL